MRYTRHHTTRALITVLSTALLAGLPGTAYAQQSPTAPGFEPSPQPILFPNSSSSYNQQGFNLPSAPRATGQDVVRGAGGISCQSAIGSGGPTLDMGVIGTNDIYNRDSAALYGRLTIPLGKRPKRVDCTRLFELEVSRLQMELELMRAAQQATEREANRPVIYEDAAPPERFSFGDMGQRNSQDQNGPPAKGFVLIAPATANAAEPG